MQDHSFNVIRMLTSQVRGPFAALIRQRNRPLAPCLHLQNRRPMALRRALPPHLQFQRHIRQQTTRDCLVVAQPGSKRPDTVVAGRSQTERSDLRLRDSFWGPGVMCIGRSPASLRRFVNALQSSNLCRRCTCASLDCCSKFQLSGCWSTPSAPEKQSSQGRTSHCR